MRVTLQAGLPWLGVLTVAYVVVSRRRTTQGPMPAVGGDGPGPAVPTNRAA
jgi:hypothetical protein